MERILEQPICLQVAKESGTLKNKPLCLQNEAQAAQEAGATYSFYSGSALGMLGDLVFSHFPLGEILFIPDNKTQDSSTTTHGLIYCVNLHKLPWKKKKSEAIKGVKNEASLTEAVQLSSEVRPTLP